MRRKKTILVSLAIAVPLVAALGMKKVSGSEPPGRLVVNPDGTVTDTVTKLIWQQASTGGAEATGLTACAALSLGSRTTGWRLPTIKELISIVDFESATAPLIDTAAFPGTLTVTYATSSPTSDAVGFQDGRIYAGNGGSEFRCVHSPP